jgi:succinoglycan biosynthesis protein ExoM
MAENLKSVLIGVCTAQRPKMLKACLDSLAAQIVPEHVSLRAVVVDNEAEPNNRAAVEAQAARFPFPLAYEHEPRRGIPFARNRVLDHALAMNAEWIAFIDDDEMAEPDWLAQLVSAAERYGCDVVQGQVYQFADGDEPSRENGKRRLPDGTERRSAATGNVLFRSWIAAEFGLNLRFDQALALSGGEDLDFFGRARSPGMKIVHCPYAVVHERLTWDRLTAGAIARRAFSRHINVYLRTRPAGSVGAASVHAIYKISRAVVSVFASMLHIIEAILVLPFSRKYSRRLLKDSITKFVKLPATIAAICGFRYDRYKKISGE